MPALPMVSQVQGDLTAEMEEAAYASGWLAIDCETTGLDWRRDALATVQVTADGANVEVLRVDDAPPKRLLVLLESPDVIKVFHHAMFDLRFIVSRWAAEPTRIACTKIAAKVLTAAEGLPSTSLKPLANAFLAVDIDKSQQRSDWMADLSDAQLDYAAEDVRHLRALLGAIEERLREHQLLDLAQQCFAHVPTRLKLDLLLLPDVFSY